MRPSYLPYLFLFVVLFASCTDDKFFDNLSVPSLTIAPNATSYISESGLPYIESTLISQQDSQVFQVSMEKGTKYMIVATQPLSEYNATHITLVNMYGDTLAESNSSIIDKSTITLKSPETAQYYIILKLSGLSNPGFDFRLYFETIVEKEINYAGLLWKATGDWENVSTNGLSIQNNNSRIIRQLKLLSTDNPNGNLSFKIKNSGNDRPNFGVVFEGDDVYYYSWQLPYEIPSGSLFLTINEAQSVTSWTKMFNGYSGHTNSLDKAAIDFCKGVQVDVKYTPSGYSIYLNNYLIENFANGFLNYFYILVEDRGNSQTIIEDFNLEKQ